MAHYKVGDWILSAEEYNEDLIFKWRLGLFAVGILLAGFMVHEFAPADWPKWLRFSVAIAGGTVIGGVLAYFAKQIESLVAWVVCAAVVFIVGAVIWSFI